MDRGALIGGAAVVAALAGVVGFYLVLSSGSTGDVAEYDREKPVVEALTQRGGGDRQPVGRRAAAGPDGLRVERGERPNLGKPRPYDAEIAKDWATKRAEAAARDRKLAESQFNDFLSRSGMDEDEQKSVMTIFETNFDTRDDVRGKMESGDVSPREGRALLAEQREGMKESLLEVVNPEQFEQLQERMNKVRVVLF